MAGHPRVKGKQEEEGRGGGKGGGGKKDLVVGGGMGRPETRVGLNMFFFSMFPTSCKIQC